MARRRTKGGGLHWVWELFVEYIIAAVANGMVEAIGWAIRKYRKRKKKKQQQAKAAVQDDDIEIE
jgi:hypothetical protein